MYTAPFGEDIKEGQLMGDKDESDSKTIDFDFEKATGFRVVHVDGVFGGPTPRRGLFQIAFYNERWPIPKKVTHVLVADGAGRELQREGREAVFREVEFSAIMTEATARSLRDWLSRHLDKLEELEADPEQQGGEES